MGRSNRPSLYTFVSNLGIMQIEFRKHVIHKRFTVAGKPRSVEQQTGWDLVLVDGSQIGLTPSETNSQHYGKLYPLSMGLPKEYCEQIVAESAGRLFSSLPSPVPHRTEDDADE